MEEVKVTPKKSTLNIASTLCWILAILNLVNGLVGISGIFPGISLRLDVTQLMIGSVAALILGVSLCVAGYGLRKKQRYAGIVAIIFGVCAFFSTPLMLGWILGILVITFVAINWKELK